MQRIDVGDAAFAGIVILSRRPLAPLLWALVVATFVAVIIALFGGLVVKFVQAMTANGGKPDLPVFLSLLAGMIGAYLVFLIGSLSVSAVVACAVIRVVLEPGDSAFGYLRLGRREFRMILLNLCKALLVLVCSIAVGMLAGIASLALTATSPSAFLVSRILTQAVVNGVVYYLYLRFSLAAPMTFDQQRFLLFESWSMTRGHVWRLFLVGLIVVLMSIAVYVLVVVVGVAGGLAMWRDVPGLANPKIFFSRPPAAWIQPLAPIIGLASVLGIVLIALLTPLSVAPWARAYRQLRPEDDLAAAFA